MNTHTDLLFDIPETKSPRLLWMERHKVKIYDASRTALYMKGDDPPFWCWFGDRTPEQIAETGSKDDEFFTQADSREEAISKHAKLKGIRLWNEERQAERCRPMNAPNNTQDADGGILSSALFGLRPYHEESADVNISPPMCALNPSNL